MNILITGGSGFIGHNLIRLLSGNGYRIKCLDRYEAPFLKEYGASFIPGDISERHLTEQALEGIDTVIHLACTILPQMSNSDPEYDIQTNVEGTISLLDAAVKKKVRKFIFLSSGGTVYGIPQTTPIPEEHPTNPTCSYGITKLMIEKYLRLYHQLYGIQTHAVRMSNPYGRFQRVRSPQGVIPVFCYKALKEETIQIWGDGSVQRDFICIDDAVSAIQKLLECDEELFEVNIGSGRATSLNSLIAVIENILGKKQKVEYLAGRNFDVPVNVLDISRARRVLLWEPQISLHDGLEQTIRWIKENES